MAKSTFWSDHDLDLADPAYRDEFLKQARRISEVDRAHNEVAEMAHQPGSDAPHEEECPLCLLEALVEEPTISRHERKLRRRDLAHFIESLPEEG
jgi:hypothetical protein